MYECTEGVRNYSLILCSKELSVTWSHDMDSYYGGFNTKIFLIYHNTNQ